MEPNIFNQDIIAIPVMDSSLKLNMLRSEENTKLQKEKLGDNYISLGSKDNENSNFLVNLDDSDMYSSF
jgi:hypothetical protein